MAAPRRFLGFLGLAATMSSTCGISPSRLARTFGPTRTLAVLFAAAGSALSWIKDSEEPAKKRTLAQNRMAIFLVMPVLP